MIELIEDTAVVEVNLLRLLPAAEHLVDGEEIHLGELPDVLGRDLGIARPVVVLAGEILAFLAVEILQIVDLAKKASATGIRQKI